MKRLLFAMAVLAYVGTASGLSCASANDTATFHCPGGSCSEPANLSEYGLFDPNSSVFVPEEGYLPYLSWQYREAREVADNPEDTVPEDLRDLYDNKYKDKGVVVNVEQDRQLPSAKEARERDRALCSLTLHRHYYPKSAFNTSYLKDTTDCYSTRVEDSGKYFEVYREGTAEPQGCVKKTRGERISGGETHYYEKENWSSGGILVFILSLFI